MNPTISRAAVELRLGKICGRFPQDLIRALQLAILTLQLFQALALVGRQVSLELCSSFCPRPNIAGKPTAPKIGLQGCQ